MKIEPTKDDLRRITHIGVNSTYGRWLKWKDTLNFNVGDILIKEVNSGWGEEKWQVEKASQKSSFPAKYVYLFKDVNGMGYIKKLSIDGSGTIGSPMSLFDMNLDRVRFKVDADFQDAILLGAEEGYDPAKSHLEKKKLRAEIREYNMKQVVRIKNVPEMETFLISNLGNTVWLGRDRTGDNFTEVVVTSIDDNSYGTYGSTMGVNLRPTLEAAFYTNVGALFNTYIIFKTRPKSVKDQV